MIDWHDGPPMPLSLDTDPKMYTCKYVESTDLFHIYRLIQIPSCSYQMTITPYSTRSVLVR